MLSAAPERWEAGLPAGIVEAGPAFAREFKKLRSVLVLSHLTRCWKGPSGASIMMSSGPLALVPERG